MFKRKKSLKEKKLNNVVKKPSVVEVPISTDEQDYLFSALSCIIKYLSSNASGVDSIFIRLPPNQDASTVDEMIVAALQQLISDLKAAKYRDDDESETNTSIVNIACSKQDPLMWALMLKKIFKWLKNPFISTSTSLNILKYSKGDETERIKSIKNALQEVPFKSFTILSKLCFLLRSVDTDNAKLGYMFGPLVFLPRDDDMVNKQTSQALLVQAEATTETMKLLLNRCEDVFGAAPAGAASPIASSVPSIQAQISSGSNDAVPTNASSVAPPSLSQVSKANDRPYSLSQESNISGNTVDNEFDDEADGSALPRAEVNYDFEAEADGELTVYVGDVVEILEQAEDGWWTARVINEDGTVEEGVFPGTYCTILDDNDDEQEIQNEEFDATYEAVESESEDEPEPEPQPVVQQMKSPAPPVRETTPIPVVKEVKAPAPPTRDTPMVREVKAPAPPVRETAAIPVVKEVKAPAPPTRDTPMVREVKAPVPPVRETAPVPVVKEVKAPAPPIRETTPAPPVRDTTPTPVVQRMQSTPGVAAAAASVAMAASSQASAAPTETTGAAQYDDGDGEDPGPEVRARALFDFDAEEEGELRIRKNQLLTITDRGDPEWWFARLDNGVEGLIPFNYVTLLEDAPVPKAKVSKVSQPMATPINQTQPPITQNKYPVTSNQPISAAPIRQIPQPTSQNNNRPVAMPIRQMPTVSAVNQPVSTAPQPIRQQHPMNQVAQNLTSTTSTNDNIRKAPARSAPMPTQTQQGAGNNGNRSRPTRQAPVPPKALPHSSATSNHPVHPGSAAARRGPPAGQRGTPQEWLINQQRFQYYLKYFNDMKVKGPDGKFYVDGKHTADFLLKSKLEKQMVARVLEISDIDRDRRFDRDEFVLAFHLVVCIKKKNMPFPKELPKYLIPKSKKHIIK